VTIRFSASGFALGTQKKQTLATELRELYRTFTTTTRRPELVSAMPATALSSGCCTLPRASRYAPRASARRLAPHAAAGSVVVPPAWPGRAEAPAVAKQSWTGAKPISLIGSTGSIGTQTLDIVGEFPEQYKVVALSAGSNIELLAEQARPTLRCACGLRCYGACSSRAGFPCCARAAILWEAAVFVSARQLQCMLNADPNRFLAAQVRKFKPSLVSISDASKVAQLKELIKDVQPQPESAPLLCFHVWTDI
jgi:hypothetical protein